MTEKLDCVVVGAGVVGLAIKRSLTLAGREVLVLETEAQIGMHSSSRNSEVMHAGSTIQRIRSRRDRGHVPLLKQYFAKGHYFAYQGQSPFRHLVYPVPSGGGLGIHATNDLAGTTRFGPDVTWIDDVDYDFDESRKPDFVTTNQSYFPGLDESKLVPAFTGVRPRLHGPGEPAADFEIQGVKDHGVRGLVNLFGIESPGSTSALAIGEYVKRILF